MKRLLPLAGLFVVLVASVLNAQTTIMRFDVPFDFQMGNLLMPAGEYTVTYSTFLVRLSAADRLHVATSTAIPSSRKTASAKGLLIFNRYGSDYFLNGVWAPNSRDGSSVPMSSREKEIASRIGPSHTETTFSTK